MASEEEKKTDDNAEKPKKKIPMIVLALSAQMLVILAALGMVVKGVFFTKGPDMSIKNLQERAIASVKDDSNKKRLMDLKDFTITVGRQHVLKANIELEVSDEQTLQIIERRMPAIKYKIINLLSNVDTKRTGSFQGKLALKDSLREAINDEIIEAGHVSGVVREVFFTNFYLM